MSSASPKKSLTKILDSLCPDDEPKVRVGEIVDSLNSRGFGALLIIPALLVVSPLGALPGACAVLGGIIFLTSVQIFLGLRRPWLPEFLRRISIRTNRLKNFVKTAKPPARKIEGFFRRRFSLLADNPMSYRITALICMVLSVGILTLSLVPFAPAICALPILFFALGLIMHDGVMTAAGYSAFFLSLAGAAMLF